MELAPVLERAVRQKVDNFCETRILLWDHYPNWAFPDKDPKDKKSSEHVEDSEDAEKFLKRNGKKCYIWFYVNPHMKFPTTLQKI